MIALVFLGIPGVWQIVLLVFVILLLFGGRKIPELMKGIGQGMKEFKNATIVDEEEDKEKTEEEEDKKDKKDK
jgi:sec-independent protein translocase protein TatA